MKTIDAGTAFVAAVAGGGLGGGLGGGELRPGGACDDD